MDDHGDIVISKLKFILPVLLVAAGVMYKFVLSKPSEPAPKPKIAGTVYVLPKEFLVNLADGRYLKLTLALELAHEEGGEKKEEETAKPPEGFGSLPQEAIVRSLTTDVLTDVDADEFLSGKGRKHVKERILEAIERKSDVKAHAIFFSDLTVQ